MSSSPPDSQTPSCATILHSFLQVEGLPFADVLTAEHCHELFTRPGLAWKPTPAPGTPTATPPHPDARAVPDTVAPPRRAPELVPAADTTAVPAARPTPADTGDGPRAVAATVAGPLRDLSGGHRTGAVPEAPASPTAARCPTWTTALTLWTFLHQVVSTSKACTAAVLRSVVLLTALGCRRPSPIPGAYSKARGRLPTGLVRDLSLDLAVRLEDALPAAWRWHGHRVLLVDGWVVTLPDTPKNQKKYPQSTSQKRGAGFPQVRLVGLFSRVSGLLLGLKYGPCLGKETGETALFRELLAQLRPGDVVVADRCYCSYFLILLLQQRGVEVVFHLHQRRKHAFGNGQALGPEDELVVWEKPQCPDWLDEATYAALPETLQVRITARRVAIPGFRTQYVRVVTTLRDATRYSKDALVGLYRERWGVEGLVRSLKTYQGMEELRCRTPEMVEKELWVNVLAYNLTRKIMCQAAVFHGLQPWQVSFTGTTQALDAYRQSLATATPEGARELGRQLVEGLKSTLVGNRPDRVEPRLKKRRPKQYGRLTKPRAEARAEVLNRPGGERRRKDWRREPGKEAAPWVG